MKTSALRASDCARFESSMAPYVDGELDPGHAVDMEEHVVSCGHCAELVALTRALRSSAKRTCARRAPDLLRAKVCTRMQDERQKAQDGPETLGPRLIRLRYAVGLAAAAGVVFAMGVTRHQQANQGFAGTKAWANDATAAPAMFDTLLDDLVALHANPLPPETTNPDELVRWDPLVGVPVRRPPFQPFGASFSGARVHAMADRRAALLQYTVAGGHRISVYVFNPRSVPVQATRLEPRFVRQQEIYIGKVRGYSVAAAEQRGVGYAIASDLGDDQSAQMVVAALQQ